MEYKSRSMLQSQSAATGYMCRIVNFEKDISQYETAESKAFFRIVGSRPLAPAGKLHARLLASATPPIEGWRGHVSNKNGYCEYRV